MYRWLYLQKKNRSRALIQAAGSTRVMFPRRVLALRAMFVLASYLSGVAMATSSLVIACSSWSRNNRFHASARSLISEPTFWTCPACTATLIVCAAFGRDSNHFCYQQPRAAQPVVAHELFAQLGHARHVAVNAPSLEKEEPTLIL
jgi:hypothetical protein